MEFLESGAETSGRSRTPEDDSILQEILGNMNSRMDMKLTKGDLEKQSGHVYETYLSNVVLSAEVEDYLAQITQNAETKVERLYAIEDAFINGNHFLYTENPGELPDSLRAYAGVW